MCISVLLEIKPKESTGAQVEEDNDIDDLFEQELRKANAEMINEVSNMFFYIWKNK